MVGRTRVFTLDFKNQLELQWHSNFNINNSKLSEIKVMSMNMWGIHTDFDRFKRSIFGKTICVDFMFICLMKVLKLEKF